MNKNTSGVPYAVIAPLGVLLTLGCCLLARMLPGALFADLFGEAYVAAFSVLNSMPLHFFVLCIISLPLLASGIVCALLRKKSKVRWIVFAVCAVLYIPLFFVGIVLDTFSPKVAAMFFTSPVLIEYYVQLDRMGMLGLGLAAFVIFLFSHLCMLPRIHTAAKITAFSVFFVLTLVLVPVYSLAFMAWLDMPMQVMLSALPATLTALLPAGLVLLLMGIFMRPKQNNAPAPVQEEVSVPVPMPVQEEPVPAAPEESVQAEETPAPVEEPVNTGVIFYAKKTNLAAKEPNDWLYTVWEIYKNGTVAAHSAAGGNVSVPVKLQLNREGCQQLTTLLQSFTFCDAQEIAGNESWEMCGYTAQGEVAHRTAGSIAGVPGLEAIAEFLDTGLWAYIVKQEQNGGMQ